MMRWKQKNDRDGNPVPNCWEACDYIVARVAVGTVQRFIVTAPGHSKPFLYADSREEVLAGIREHRQWVVA